MHSNALRSAIFQPGWLSYLVLAVGIGCTLFGFQYARQQEHQRIANAFNELVRLKTQRVALRVEGYQRTLLDLRGLFSSDPNVTGMEFQKYLDGVGVSLRYAALRRIGYAPLQRASGHFPVLYSYPADQSLVGKYLDADPARSRALEQARDTDQARLSHQLSLRFDPEHRPGFVIFVPLYQGGLSPATPEQRRRALSGYLFAVFRTGDLIDSTIGPAFARQMELALFDGAGVDPGNLAYDSGSAVRLAASGGEQSYTSVEQAEVGGNPWTFLFVARPQFVLDQQSRLSRTVLASGLLVSILGAGLASALARRLRAEQTVRFLAFHDELTGLPNRAALRSELLAAARREQATGEPCALLIVELTRFREINYTLGHQIGDAVLQQVARCFQKVAAGRASVARIGNTQFGLLLNNGSVQDAVELATRLLTALEEPLPVNDSNFELSAKVGIVAVPAHGSDPDDLIRHADIALNLARSTGRAYAVYDPALDLYQPRRLAMLGEFRRAIKEHQLLLYCQPKADLRTGAVCSVEALVRWQHPTYGLLSPDQFISLIEPTELIHLLTQRMLEAALRQGHAWRQLGLQLPIAVNLSTRNLLDPALPELIRSLMQSWGADTSWVSLEITESSIMEDPAASLRVLNELHKMGLTLSVDDFGIGYSSLSYLMKLPVAVIKIDHSFTMNMIRDRDAATIVRTIIELAHNLGMKVVAEGACSKEIWDALKRLDCDQAQGYYISPPMPAHAIADWLAASPWRDRSPA
jgi:diguanylate cyclase (GGDEF)-like protein